MKKHLLSVAIIVITFMLSGCQQSVEHRIKRGFKNYVQTTFDNPKDLLEIVSISDIPDTVSAVQIANMALSAETDIKSVLDEYNKLTDSLLIFLNSKSSRLRSPNSLSYSERLEGAQLNEQMGENLEKLEEDGPARIVQSYNVKKMLEAGEYPIYYDFEIRARVKEDNKIKLKSYYAYTTNIDSVFTFRNEEFRFSDMSKESEQLCREATQLFKMVNSEFDTKIEFIENLKKLTKLLVKK